MAKPDIIVFCDRESPKHGKKHPNPVVHAFRKAEDGWGDFVTSKRLQNAGAPHTATRALIGNEKWDADNPDHRSSRPRWSFTLTCLKCGFNVPVTQENVDPALDNMARMGIDRIGLMKLQEGLFGTGDNA